jgi:hypothetical protein
MMIRSATSLSRMVFIRNPDVFAFLEPLRFDVSGSPVRQHHQGIFDALSRLCCCWDNHIDVSCRSLIAVGG